MNRRARHLRPALAALLLAAMLAACAQVNVLGPDLKRLYGLGMQHDGPQPPVVLIPGVLGSKLRDRHTGREVWPGGWKDIFFSDYRELALEIDPVTLQPKPSPLEAFDITEEALGQDIYRPIIRTLEHAGGYSRGQPGTPASTGDRRYYVFAYDWRQDNMVSARALHALIERIRADYRDPDLKVDIIAHSMGGLVARYYLRYGTTDVLDRNDFPVNLEGAKRIRKLIQLGSPNLGSIYSLHSFLSGFRVIFGVIPTEVLATMPSGPQLFPHPITDWIITLKGEPLDRDLFGIHLWRRFQWSLFDPKVIARIRARHADPAAGEAQVALMQRYFGKQLERARRFVWSLTVPLPATPVRLVAFGGDCELTPARILVEEENGDSVVRRYPKEIKRPVAGVDYERLMLEPGDGRVTKPSLLARDSLDPTVPRHKYSFFPLDYAFFLCEDHDRLTNNLNFQDNLLNILLERSQALENDPARRMQDARPAQGDR